MLRRKEEEKGASLKSSTATLLNSLILYSDPFFFVPFTKNLFQYIIIVCMEESIK